MAALGADLTMDFVVFFEEGAFRVGDKRLITSTGSTNDGGIALHYYEYEVYCDRSVLVGKVLQTAILKDMQGNTNDPPFLWPGGLCSILTMKIHPGLAVEYRGRSIPVETAQHMTMGQLVDHLSSNNRMRLIGTMDVAACLPCCCFIPKLLDENMIPWNQYDIYNPKHDFSMPPQPMPMERAPTPSFLLEQHPRYGSSQVISNIGVSTKPSSFNDTDCKTAGGGDDGGSKEKDVQALEQLRESGVLSQAEYDSKVHQVKEKYNSEMENEIEALSRLYEDGILTETEFETKRDIVHSLHH